MNSDFPQTPREELEARITALLLGELSEAEAELLRRRIAEEPELVRLHDQLKQTIGLVREATGSPEHELAQNEAPKLSAERREILLKTFQVKRPKQFKPKRQWNTQWREVAALAAMIIGLLVIGGGFLWYRRGGQFSEEAFSEARIDALAFDAESLPQPAEPHFNASLWSQDTLTVNPGQKPDHSGEALGIEAKANGGAGPTPSRPTLALGAPVIISGSMQPIPNEAAQQASDLGTAISRTISTTEALGVDSTYATIAGGNAMTIPMPLPASESSTFYDPNRKPVTRETQVVQKPKTEAPVQAFDLSGPGAYTASIDSKNGLQQPPTPIVPRPLNTASARARIALPVTKEAESGNSWFGNAQDKFLDQNRGFDGSASERGEKLRSNEPQPGADEKSYITRKYSSASDLSRADAAGKEPQAQEQAVEFHKRAGASDSLGDAPTATDRLAKYQGPHSLLGPAPGQAPSKPSAGYGLVVNEDSDDLAGALDRESSPARVELTGVVTNIAGAPRALLEITEINPGERPGTNATYSVSGDALLRAGQTSSSVALNSDSRLGGGGGFGGDGFGAPISGWKEGVMGASEGDGKDLFFRSKTSERDDAENGRKLAEISKIYDAKAVGYLDGTEVPPPSNPEPKPTADAAKPYFRSNFGKDRLEIALPKAREDEEREKQKRAGAIVVNEINFNNPKATPVEEFAGVSDAEAESDRLRFGQEAKKNGVAVAGRLFANQRATSQALRELTDEEKKDLGKRKDLKGIDWQEIAQSERALEREKEQVISSDFLRSAEGDLSQVLNGYQKLTGRTLVQTNSLPDTRVSIKTETSLTRTEAIEALNSALALNQIVMMNQGDKFVKAVPQSQAPSEANPFNEPPSNQLSQTSRDITQIVQLKNALPREVAPALAPLAKSPGDGIRAIDNSGILVIRDSEANVKRMLELVDKLDVAPQQEFEPIVIPIKNTAAAEIAQKLGTRNVTDVGSQQTRTGLTTAGGAGGISGSGGSSGPATNYNVPGGGKIIVDQRSNSLLIFARKQEIEKMKGIVAKLDGAEKQVEVRDDETRRTPPAAPIPQPEVSAVENPFSTFSLNVSDVSFKLGAASLEKGQMPEAASVRSEEFINAFDYRDPEPAGSARVAFNWDRARYPFGHNRDILRFSVKTAAIGRQAGRPLNLVLLLDNSGSMERADRVRIIQECLRVLAKQLTAQDRVSVVAFSRTARLWVDGLPGNQAGELPERVGGLMPQGGTNLEDAMNVAYQTALRHYLTNGVNRVVLLTDGAANLGDVEPESLKKKVEANRLQGIALDCFGIGWEGYNDDLLETLSRNGDGRYGFVNTPEAAASEFAGQLAGALKVAASDVKVQVEFNPKRVTTYRQIGYAKHQLKKEQFRDNTVDAAEIGAAEAGNALYVVQVNPHGEGPLATVRVRYKVPGTSDYREHEWAVPYAGPAKSLEQSSVAMRLATVASAFSEWLASSPYAGEVAPGELLNYLSGVPETCNADPRPKKLEWMIRQAKAISGK